MTSIFSDGALHPGRDANESRWLVLRRPEDWASAALTNVVVDPVAPALVLAPAPLAIGPGSSEIAAEDGARYRSEPDAHLVLRRGPCDAAWTRLVGARGTETGKLHRPLGLALDRARGLLAIADSGNHRVQVVRAETGEPVVVLGCSDVWGRGVVSGDPRSLAEPVAVGFGGRRLAIADCAGGKVHIYDDRFVWRAAFAPVPPHAPAGFVPAPVAVAIASALVWVIDAGWSIPVAYALDGEVAPDAGPAPADLASWLAHARSAARGEVVIGPIDGRSEELPWHRVIVDATIPAGASVEVQTFASDDAIAPAVIPWAPARPVRLPLAGVEPNDGEIARPVLSDHGRWARKRGEPYQRASRPIGRLVGTGPINAAGLAAPWPVARRLRAGDEIELRTPGPAGLAVRRAIASIAGRSIRAVTRGDLQLYGAGSRLMLVERAGEMPLGGPRLLATFASGQTLDLSGAAGDAALHDLPASHAIAALVRDGDVIRVDDGAAAAATIVVDTVDTGDATIVLALAVVGDFSTSDLRIAIATDRLIVDALGWTEAVPGGEVVLVHDDVAGASVAATLRWAELDTGALWLDPGPPIPWATWTRFTLPAPGPTDRGRYLWLRLGLLGAIAHPGDDVAIAGPVIRSVRLLSPRLSFLRYLPAVYSRRDDDDPSGALFLERLLALPESRLTGIEAAYESIARELNPAASSPDWLRFVAAWYGLVFDPSWPMERRRALVTAAHDLFARRGTVDGIRRYLEIYLGTTPAILEGFQWGALPPSMLGGDHALGTTALGAAPGGDGGLAHHFSIWVFGDDGACAGGGPGALAKAARAILDSIKPAHTTYDLHVVDGPPRVGIRSTVGVDMVLSGGELHPPIGPISQPPSVLGWTTLPAARADVSTPRLAPIPLDDNFTLT
ncbi:hypothetical protein BE20_29425 [Sorangium cellulosum]|nr:hypothetical protein BE20_29425 [Sorangium cellulosum]